MTKHPNDPTNRESKRPWKRETTEPTSKKAKRAQNHESARDPEGDETYDFKGQEKRLDLLAEIQIVLTGGG